MTTDRDLVADADHMLARTVAGPGMTPDPIGAYNWMVENLPALLAEHESLRARVAELEAQVDSDRLKAGAAVLNLECELEAAQRPPLGMRDIADTLAFLAIKTTRDDTDDIRPIAAKQLRADLTDVFEELLDRLPEGTIGEVREVQP